METQTEIKHHKEVHSFYIFTGLVVLGVLILQPLTMTLIVVMQTLTQQ